MAIEFNNKQKYMAFMLLSFFSTIVTILGIIMYYMIYKRLLKHIVVDKADRYDKWYLIYETFSLPIAYASYAAMLTGLLGLLAARFRKYGTSSLFVFAAVCSAFVCFYNASTSLNFTIDNRNHVCVETKDGKTISNEW